MSDDMKAEIERLKAENERLNATAVVELQAS